MDYMQESYYYWQCPICHKETYNLLQQREHIAQTIRDEKHRYHDDFSRYHIETQTTVFSYLQE